MALSDSISIQHQLGWRQRWSPLLVALLVAAVVLAITWYVQSIQLAAARQEQRIRISNAASAVRAQIEGEINSSVHLCLGLVTFVSANPDFTEDAFIRIARSMMSYGRHVRDIAIAPDNVVRYVYPLEGNRQVLGLRYMDHPEQRYAVEHMMQTRQFVLAGPVDLVQGGRGFVNRLPIYDSSKGQQHYWGLASVVLDVDSLLGATGITRPQPGIRYALRGKDGLGARGGMIYGDAALFEQNPILLDVVMLGDSRWQLAAVPQSGWNAALADDNVRQIRGVGLLLAFLLGGLTYFWLREIRNLQLRDAALRLAAGVFQSASEGIVVTDTDRRIIAVNPAVGRITGYADDELLGQPADMLSADKPTPEQEQEIATALSANSSWHGEALGKHKDGRVYPKALTITAVADERGNPQHFVNTFSDISERKSTEARIHHLAHHDPLTGLPNRTDLYSRLQQAMAAAVRHRSLLAVMILDMDNFKIINDTLGHHIGDGILIEVARRLTQGVRNSDIVSRLGGDEFVIVLTEVESAAAVAGVAVKVLQKLSQTYQIQGYELHSSSSIGIGLFPQDGETADSLLKNVDTAMYHAKSLGRNNYQFFTEEMRLAVDERLRLENSLRQAISRGEFLLHYQPQVDIASGVIVGVEALLRWQHPELGLVPPAKFIGVAEESDFIVQIGEWVLREACRQRQQWQSAGIQLRMSVNLSPRQLRSKDLFSLVSRLMRKYSIKPGELELEITESAAMENPDETIALLERLRQMGVHLAIDDFGTGYSSLSYLKLLPINRLKIDRSFVKDIETDPSDAAICSATIALAHILELSLVAEGVETEVQLDFLRKQGCDTAQGYLFSKPLPAEELSALLASRGEHTLTRQ